MSKTARVYKIEMLIRNRGHVSFQTLLDELEVSPATLKRDLEYLRDQLGAPIEYDRDVNGYCMGREYRGQKHELPGLWFDERELYSLLMAHQLLSELDEQGTLTRIRKFETDTTAPQFRQKAEQRLFQNQKTARWSEIKRRAAMKDDWPLHRPDALDALRSKAVNEGHWRDLGDSVEIGPFPPPKTEVHVRPLSRDDDTGEASLKVMPVNGDTVYYEIGEARPTTASLKVSDAEGGYNNFRTNELKLTFLCVDSSGKHETGSTFVWKNPIAVKYRVYQQGDDWCAELRAVPRGKIKYTTNGADPVASGGAYDAPFVLPKDCRFVLAVATEDDQTSPVERIDVQEYQTKKVTVDPAKPVTWNRPHQNLAAAKAFGFIDSLEKHGGLAREMVVDITANEADISLTFIASGDEVVSGARLREVVAKLQEIAAGGSQVTLSAASIRFERGQQLLDWIAGIHGALQPGEVSQ